MMYPYQDEDKIREGTPTVSEGLSVWEQPAVRVQSKRAALSKPKCPTAGILAAKTQRRIGRHFGSKADEPDVLWR